MDFMDAVDVDLLGVMNAVAVALPRLGEGASIIVTGSNAGLMPSTTDNPAIGPGGAGYGRAKRSWSPTPSRWRCSWRRGSCG